MGFGGDNVCVTDGTSHGQGFLDKVTYGQNSVKFTDILHITWFLIAHNIVVYQYAHLISQNYSKCKLYQHKIGVTDGTGLSVTDGTVLSDHIPVSILESNSQIFWFKCKKNTSIQYWHTLTNY